MKSRILTGITLLSLLIGLGVPVQLAAQDQQHYRVFSLGGLGGTSGAGNTINNLGWAMGVADLSGNTASHATVWAYGSTFDLGTLGGLNSAIDWTVKNDRGTIAGIAETSTVDPLGETWSCAAFFPPPATGHVCLGFLWQGGLAGGAMTALPTLGGNNGYAAGVNNRNEVVGWAENTTHDPTCVPPQVLQFEAVIYGPENGRIRELPTYPGDPDGAATAINDHEQAVGISGICQNAVGDLSAKHALLWENGTVTNLGNLGGVAWNTPTAINNEGQVVGFSDLPGDENGQNPNFHAFLWTEQGGMQDLGTLPGDAISEATGINNLGQVIGVSYTAGFASSRAFLWQNGVMTDLNTLIPPDSSLYLISTGDINDSGEITGQACVLSNGACTSEVPAFVAIPTPARDAGEAASPAALAGGKPVPALPDSVRQQLRRRLGLDRSLAKSITPQ